MAPQDTCKSCGQLLEIESTLMSDENGWSGSRCLNLNCHRYGRLACPECNRFLMKTKTAWACPHCWSPEDAEIEARWFLEVTEQLHDQDSGELRDKLEEARTRIRWLLRGPMASR